MKLCIDCKFFNQHGHPDFPKRYCDRPALLDNVMGWSDTECAAERSDGIIASKIFDTCGQAGKYWEAK